MCSCAHNNNIMSTKIIIWMLNYWAVEQSMEFVKGLLRMQQALICSLICFTSSVCSFWTVSLLRDGPTLVCTKLLNSHDTNIITSQICKHCTTHLNWTLLCPEQCCRGPIYIVKICLIVEHRYAYQDISDNCQDKVIVHVYSSDLTYKSQMMWGRNIYVECRQQKIAKISTRQTQGR